MKEETARMAWMMQIPPNQKCDSGSHGSLPEAILKGYSKYEGSRLKSSLQCRLEHMQQNKEEPRNGFKVEEQEEITEQ